MGVVCLRNWGCESECMRVVGVNIVYDANRFASTIGECESSCFLGYVRDCWVNVGRGADRGAGVPEFLDSLLDLRG